MCDQESHNHKETQNIPAVPRLSVTSHNFFHWLPSATLIRANWFPWCDYGLLSVWKSVIWIQSWNRSPWDSPSVWILSLCINIWWLAIILRGWKVYLLPSSILLYDSTMLYPLPFSGQSSYFQLVYLTVELLGALWYGSCMQAQLFFSWGGVFEYARL